MTTRTKAQETERQEALATLRELCPPGTTLYTVVRHVSRSGMHRLIDVYVIEDSQPRWLSGLIARLGTFTLDKKKEALRVGGCGMDMGFHVVEAVSYALWGKEGYQCLGKGKCPSNYHVNHRDTVRCEGVESGPEGRRTSCYHPSRWNGAEIPADWPRLAPHEIEHEGETISVERGPASCITEDAEGNEITPYVCPTCKGEGHLPNPEGPERFDLTHKDGYALRQRWM